MSDTEQLIAEMEDLLIRIDNQIRQVRGDAERRRASFNPLPGDIIRKIDIHSLQDVNGNYLLTPLLLAKAHCLSILIPIRQQREAQAKLDESLAGVRKFFEPRDTD